MEKLLKASSALAIIAGIILLLGGGWGIYFTHKNIAQENIITPKDAAIPQEPVRGPFTLKAQAEVIRKHTLAMTGNKTYAEMPKQIPKLDDKGNALVDGTGNPLLIANTSRDIWITATTLTTALNLGILTYAFSGVIILLGCISIWNGFILYALWKSAHLPSITKK